MNAAARARLEGWKLSLLDLSASNRLLDASKDERVCFGLPGVDPVRIAAALSSGSSFGFETGMESCFDTGRLRVPLGASELERRLVALRRASRDAAMRGEHVLWLALGMLHWCEGEATHAAPLWLVPVELDAAMRLAPAEAIAPTFNHLLGQKLKTTFDIVFDPGNELPVVLAAAEGIAVTRPGWRVERGVRVGVFSFAQLAVWKDLEALDLSQLLASPVLSHLVDGTAAFPQPTPAAAALVTRARPQLPELIAPLDADASQLVAVAAAGEGASFVLQGAPGTGKSQTIANLIVNAVAHGKTVLVASTKLVALQAVQQRLASLGLGEFCLDLSAQPGKAAVAQQLARVLERAFRPGSGPSGDDTRLAELRTALDSHVAALHRVGPLGRSLHDVIGRLVELKTTPCAALAERDATGIDQGTLLRRLFAIELLAQTGKAVEPVAAHPWQRSTLLKWPADGLARVLYALDEAAGAGAALSAAVQGVAALVPGFIARTRAQLTALGALCAIAATSPRPGAELLTHLRSAREDEIGEQIALIRARGTGAVETPRDPLTYLALAHRHRALATEVADAFTDRVDDIDAHDLWSQLRKWTQSMAPVRYVALRGVRAAVREAGIPLALETDEAMITALEAVLAERATKKALLAAAEPAKRWFGELHTAELEQLDLSKLDAAVKWAAELRRAFDATDIAGGEPGKTTAWRALVAQIAATPEVEGAEATPAVFKKLAECVGRWAPSIEALAEVTGIERAAIGAGEDHLAALREQIETLRHSIDALPAWVAFHAARQGALEAGVGPAIGAIERGDLAASELARAWERATLLAWADAELAEAPGLAHFHGAAHHAHVAAFADLDRAMLALERSRALARLAERVPKPPRRGAIEEGGELGTLLLAAKKPETQPSLRALFSQIPSLLPRLAPCMLMTPQAIAEHLDPALPAFDIVVFDESSQLAVAESLGAIARAKSVVVVGDSQHLRPAGGLPSLLDVSVGARLPELRLTWHYRSKHEDLIAFANEHYYDDRLVVYPAAFSLPDFGVSWRHLEGTFVDDVNRTEAESIVADVIARLRDPQQRTRSIGIITFTTAQRDLIEDLLDEARIADPSIDIAFSEPLVVRLADAMQGEERDVIFLSFGFPPALEALATAITPRQLAVATTCAREQLVVVSSFTPEQLDVTNAVAGDIAELLVFARAGGGAARFADDAPPMKPVNPLMEAVARALTDRGWTVRHQVGVGPFKLDLAVVDPNDPDRYVLAIEHDGVSYAAAHAARDRDRLRTQVLTQLGWRLHRIWSLDWWWEPEHEIARAHGAIVTAVAASRARRAQPAASTTTTPALPMRRIARASKPAPLPSGNASAKGSAPVVRIPPSLSARAGIPDALANDATTTASAAPGVLSAPDTAAHAVANAVAGANAVGKAVTSARANAGETAAATSSAETTPHAAVHADSSAAKLAAGSAPVRLARGAIPIGPYTVAAIPAGRRAPDDMFAPRYLPELGKVVEQVLAAEAPMHVDLLARRVGSYFGIGRVSQRVTDQVRVALAGRGRWGDEENVVWRMDQDPAGVPPVRVAGQGPAALRQIEEVPLSELAAAARIVVERAPNIQPPELVRDAARLLGFARITERVTDRIALGIQLALQRTLITLDNGRARLPD